MGEFDNNWNKYWLRGNPFFTEPLEIDGSPIPIENLVGRHTEKREITNLIKMGGGTRFIVSGEAGVGKTSLINYIRYKARLENFISPIKEISIPKTPNPQKVMVETLVLLFEEIKSKKITINDEIRKKLEFLQPFADLQDYEGEGSVWVTSTTSILITLFKSLTKELVSIGFSGVVLHYNNLDKIKDEEDLLDFFQDTREFFQDNNCIFIFIGDKLLTKVISNEPRLRQIFQNPVELKGLTYEEILEVIKIRINILRVDNSKTIQILDEVVIKKLYEIFDGNLRDILTSISYAFRNMEDGNMPIKLTLFKTKDILYNAFRDRYLKKLSKTEQDILFLILENKRMTPSEITKKTGKRFQNVSSLYLKNLINANAIELVERKGTRKVYAVVPQIKWTKLKKTEEEIEEEIELKTKKLKRIKEIQTELQF